MLPLALAAAAWSCGRAELVSAPAGVPAAAEDTLQASEAGQVGQPTPSLPAAPTMPAAPADAPGSSGSPDSTPSADAVVRTDERPAGPRFFRTDWAAAPEGASPPGFVALSGRDAGFWWLYDGGWRVTKRGGEAVLEVPFARIEPVEPLSFRRYAGEAFGPDGRLPMRYRIEAEARSLGGSMRFRGYGELAIQVCFRSPLSYVEVLQTDAHLLLWEADQAPPMQGKGWTRLAQVDHPAAPGDWVRFGAEVDRAEGRVVALLNGRPVAEARSDLPRGPEAPRFTLRATGNREEWRWVEARELP
jgi:hypothetical protein